VGSLYRRGAVWWIKYYVDGRPMRESTGFTQEKAARNELKKREGRAASGQPILPRADRIRHEEIAEDLRTHYKTARADRVVPRWAQASLGRLDAFFTGWRVVTITPALVGEYVQRRQLAGAANGTINRELAVLLRMLRLADEHGKLLRLPVIRKLQEASPRAGFFERAAYEAVRCRLRPDLQVAVTIAYTYGWRVQEIVGLDRRQLDLERGTLRLDPGTTKNDEGRVVYLTPELARLLGEQLERIGRSSARQAGSSRTSSRTCPAAGGSAIGGGTSAKPGPRPYQGRVPGDAAARPSPDGRPEPGQRWRPRAGRHGHDGPLDPERLRPVSHRQPGRPPDGDPAPRRGPRAQFRAQCPPCLTSVA
jgi:integrase